MTLGTAIRKAILTLGLVGIIAGCAPRTCPPAPALSDGRPAYTCQFVDERSQVGVARLEDIIAEPWAYEGQFIQTEGYAEYVGEQSHNIVYALPYYNAATEKMQINMSISEVTVTTHRLHTEKNAESPYVTMFEKEGGAPLYLPLPLSYMPSSGQMYENKIVANGEIEKDAEGNYFLQINSAWEIGGE